MSSTENSETAKTVVHTNPSTLAEGPPFPLSTADDVDKAVQAAQSASVLWGQKSWFERKAALLSYADAVEGLTEDFAKLIVQEQGS